MRCAIAAFLLALTPLAVEAQKVTVEIDNPWARATRIVLEPHEKLAAREYPESVVVYVNAAGDTAHFPAGKRVIENTSDKPVEEVLVELKDGAGRPPSQPITLDPVKIDARYHTVDFENARVRVLRTVLAPHIKSPPHQHPAYVVVYVTELHTTMAISDGRLVDNIRLRGEVAWRDAMQHSTENIGEKTAMEIQIELK